VQFYGNEETRVDSWYETVEGRRVLAEDKRFFARKFGDQVLATRRDGQITLTGHDGHVAVSVAYPVTPGRETISVLLKDHGFTVLEISCALSRRSVGFAAAFAAAKEL
jgi:hypothetical protein